jgi:MSHA pilin protein MshB
MNSTQSGFTFIELIIVILILGILSAVAVPKFVNLEADAHASVLDGVSGAFKGGIELTRYQHLTNGSKGTIEVQGNTISFFDINGQINQYATASTPDECAQLWNNITDGLRASSIKQGNALLSINAVKGTCAYLYQDIYTITYEYATGNVLIEQNSV